MKFKFDKKQHIYTLDGRPLTGTTTILNVIAKPMLIQWSANEAVKYVGEKWYPDITYSFEEIDEILNQAKIAHRKKKEDAGQKGTDIHEILENYIKNCIKDFDGQAIDIESNGEIQVKHFVDWAGQNKIKFLESEKQVYSITYFTAGTYDFKCEINGKIYIGDIKTSSGIYGREPFAQMAAYEMMEKEMEKSVIDGRIIINLKKDGKFDEDKDVYFSYDYQTDLDLFLAALRIYRIQNNY